MKYLDKFFNKKKLERKANIDVLERFIRMNWNLVSPGESKKNLENNLIEIMYSGDHLGNGLLITENGYFLTTRHCLINKFKNKIIKIQNGRAFNEYQICEENIEDDLILAKLEYSKNFNPKIYNFYNTNVLQNIPFQLTTIKKGKIHKKYGLIDKRDYKKDEINSKNYFSINNIGEPGDSGGILISPNGELIGFEQGGMNNLTDRVIKINGALDLIYNYINNLKKSKPLKPIQSINN
ncbi:MAG: hypothetical protein WC812_00770 [Candidatus Pacearchaeota archaeon]|jgi:hypothetical protein